MNGTHSVSTDVLSGIQQGTVLGPLLFIIYINDILTNIESDGYLFADDTNIESDGYLFADDTKIFRKISTLNDSLAPQKDIHSLETKFWLLGFNRHKCHILTLGKFVNTHIVT